VKRGEGNTNSPELSLLKFLPLAYNHSHFLVGFHIFFHKSIFGGPHTFLQLGCFGLDYTGKMLKGEILVNQCFGKEIKLANLMVLSIVYNW